MPERFDYGRFLGVDGLVDGQSGRTFCKKWTDRFQSVDGQIADSGKIPLLQNEMLKSGFCCERRNPYFFKSALLI